MVKMVGSILIIVALTLVGKKASDKVRKKVKIINLFINMLQHMKDEMSYKFTPMREIFNNLLYIDPEIKELSILQICYEELDKGMTFNDSWSKGIENSECVTLLDGGELSIIKKIGKWLGSSNINNQLSNIDLSVEYLKERLQLAKIQEEKYSKMYKTLGLLSGVAVAILLW